MMLTVEVIKAQIEQYVKGKSQAMADFNAFNGAISALNGLLELNTQMESEAQELIKEAERREAGVPGDDKG